MEIKMGFKIRLTGPVSDGMAEVYAVQFQTHIVRVLGQEAVERIRAYLPEQYMYLGHHGGTPEFNPVPANAGALQAAIHYTPVAANIVKVTDTPITYGPWIEGIDSKNLIVWPHYRNPPPRRFPGYHTFRIIGQELEADAGSIAQDHIRPYIELMND